MEKEIKFKVRIPQVGDSLPLDAVWDENGAGIGRYSDQGELYFVDTLGNGDGDESALNVIASYFGLPSCVEPEKSFIIGAVPQTTEVTA